MTLSLRPLLLGGLLAFGASLPASADPAVRAVPPDAVIEGLNKVVIVDVGQDWAPFVADAVADRTRLQLGFNASVPNASPGIDTRIIAFERQTNDRVLDTAALRTIAEAAQAQAVVEVRASLVRSTDVPFERSVGRPGKDEAGNAITEQVTVPCLRREVHVTSDLRVFDAQGTLRATRSLTHTDQPQACDIPWQQQSRGSLAPTQAIARGRFQRHAETLVRTFVPHWRVFNYELVLDRIVRPMLRRVGNQSTRAVSELLAVSKVDPYNPRVLYTLGLSLELDGRPLEASYVFALAARLGNVPAYSAAVERARVAHEQAQVLEQAYGLSIVPVVRPELDKLLKRAHRAAGTETMGSPARVKGGRNRRNPVFESPSAQGEVLLTVPGRTQVRRIRTEDGFVEVQLPDGLIGWMRARRIR